MAQELAESFGGGGHPYAAGAKWQDGVLDYADIKRHVLERAKELLEKESEEGSGAP